MLSSSAIFEKSGLLKFDDLFDLVCSKFMFKCHNNLAPVNISNLFQPLSLNNRTKGYIIPKTKCKFHQQFPSFYLPKIWNTKSLRIKSEENLSKFVSLITKSFT